MEFQSFCCQTSWHQLVQVENNKVKDLLFLFLIQNFLFGNFEYPVINIADKETFGVYFHFEDIAMFVTEWIDE